MNQNVSLLLSVALVVTMWSPMTGTVFGQSGGDVEVNDLRTEYANNPLGIDVTKPRLSWKLVSSERGQSQTAYQIQVASSESELLNDNPDMWDTGKVESNQSVNVEYEGEPLESGKRYYWRVKVWDKHGSSSEWSEPAWWEMGLLEESDWKGDWIGLDAGEGEEDLNLEGAHWIWYPEGNPAENAPAGQRYFRYSFQLPPDKEISRAEMVLTADDSYVLYVNGEHADSSPQVTDAWKQARLVDVTHMLSAGHNVIAIVATNSEGPDINPAGLIGRMRIEYDSGEAHVFETSCDWKTRKMEQEGWHEPDFDDTDWDSAVEVAPYGDALWGDQVVLPGDSDKPAPLIRNEFTLDKPVAEARVYVSGLGYYELSLNGQKVGDHVLDPNSTNYEARVLYTTYDVTKQLNQGENAIGVELGRGRYGMTTPNTWIWHEAPWHDDPKVLLQLEIKYEDGSTETIVSDESWRATEGPTRFDSLYEGERYDARLVQDGWTSAGFDDTGWDHAVKVEPPAGKLRAQQHEPIKVMDTIRPKSVKEVKPGVYVFDFGVNVAGWAKLQAEGPRGTEVTLVYGEKLHDDGTVDIDQGHIYAQIQTDRYILSGEGVETWEPKFSYKGYQYVQVSGYPGEPTLDSLEGRVIHTSVASTGEFSTSDPLLNQMNENVRRAYLNNLYDVPTDTPVWEKNGWTGDAQVMAATSIYNFHMPRFYTKWVHDIRDAQKPSGELPDIVPTSGWSYDGSPGWTAVHGPTPAWDAALFEIPWEMYRQYGDERILSDVYEKMKRYFDYLASHADGHIVRLGLGDWIPPGYGGSPPEGPDLTSTAYYYRFAETISNIADILGKDAEARLYEEKALDIKAAFNEEFFDEQTNVYKTHRDVGYRQTSNAVPIAFGLAPEDREEAIIANLAEDVAERGNHLNTGIVGTKVLLPVLTEYGYEDLAYAIAAQRTYPSWGYWIENGATALYESWELSSRSRNHHMFGSVGEWFYAYLAGIQPGSPGYETIVIKPAMPEDLKQATGRVETVKGDVASSWEQHPDGTITLEVEIPANTTATVYVPADRQWGVMEGGLPAHTAEGVTFLKMEDGYAVFEIGSGSYQFTFHLVSAAYVNTLVKHFKEAGEFANHGAARALDIHLMAVNRFEEKGAAEKVVKHLKGFQQLLNNQRENDLISEEAYDVLESETLSLVDTYFAANPDT